MTGFFNWIDSCGEAFVPFALTMLVQSTLLVCVIYLLDLLVRRRVRASFRYGLWMLILVKLVLPTNLSSPVGVGSWLGAELPGEETLVQDPGTMQAYAKPALLTRVGFPASADAEPEPVHPAFSPRSSGSMPISRPHDPAEESLMSWEGILFSFWMVGLAGLICAFILRARSVRTLLSRAGEGNEEIKTDLISCQKQMGMGRHVTVKLTHTAHSPGVCGLFRPTIVMPREIISSLKENHLRAILFHELAHIKRGDLWVSTAQTLLQIFYFYNPAVWFANKMIRRIREHAVDDTVLVTLGREGKDQYLETLVRVAKLAFRRPRTSSQLLGVIESKNTLKARIKIMLNRPRPKTARLGIIGACGIILIGCFLLPMAQAQKDPENKNRRSQKKSAVSERMEVLKEQMKQLKMEMHDLQEGEKKEKKARKPKRKSRATSPMPPLPRNLPNLPDVGVGNVLSEVLGTVLPKALEGAGALAELDQQKDELEEALAAAKDHLADLKEDGASRREMERALDRVETLAARTESVRRELEHQAEKFETEMEAWASDFENQMEGWGEEYGEEMETWGETYGEEMEAWGEAFGEEMETWAEGFAGEMESLGEELEGKDFANIMESFGEEFGGKDFSGIMQQFGSVAGGLENLSEGEIEEWAEGFEHEMEEWATQFAHDLEKNLGENLSGIGETTIDEEAIEAWAEQFEKEMESWGEDFGKKMEALGRQIEQQVEAKSSSQERGKKKAQRKPTRKGKEKKKKVRVEV